MLGRINVDVRELGLHGLVTYAAELNLIIASYKEFNIPVPERVTEKLEDVRRYVAIEQASYNRRRLSELKMARKDLETKSERREAIDKEIKEREAMEQA